MFVLSLAAILLSQAGPSATERIHVEWLAPDECPDRGSLAASLESSVPKNRTFAASVRIDEPHEEGAAWRAVVVTASAGVQRTRAVEAATCARVTDAAVLVVTLAATALPHEPEYVPAPSTPAAEQQPGAVTEPEPPLEVETNTTPVKPPPPLSFRLFFQPQVSSNAGVLPVPGLAIGLAVSTRTGPILTELGVSQWLSSQTPGRRGARFDLTTVKLKGCWLFDARPKVTVGPCAGAEGGLITAQGAGITTPLSQAVFWLAALTGASGSYQLTEFMRLWVTVEAGLNFIRPVFVVNTAGGVVDVHRMGWPVGRLSVGLELRLW